jgi:hypothetical protein
MSLCAPLPCLRNCENEVEKSNLSPSCGLQIFSSTKGTVKAPWGCIWLQAENVNIQYEQDHPAIFKILVVNYKSQTKKDKGGNLKKFSLTKDGKTYASKRRLTIEMYKIY